MKPLTKKEAYELVEWKDDCFHRAVNFVNPSWAQYSNHIVATPRQNGKTAIIFEALTNAAVEFMDETMTDTQKQHYMLALDYEMILWKDEEDGGGFDSMSEAYCSGVPLEDILA